METVRLAERQTVKAAEVGEQWFEGGGPASVVALNGNPYDYRLSYVENETGGTAAYRLTATNGSGEYVLSSYIDQIRFLSGAYCLVRNLPAVIPEATPPEWGAAPPRFTSYAQIREDVLLMRALRDVDPQQGFYVDVGAYDPDVDSVTRAFYERGWRGINVEPEPALFSRFVSTRTRDINLQAAISSSSGERTFYGNDGEQLGTLEERFADASRDARRMTVSTISLSEVLDQHAVDAIHFLKVDVEGHEREVLLGCDFTRFRPWIVMVEACAPNQANVPTHGEWEDILLEAEYVFAAADELNRYYVSFEHRDLALSLSIPVDYYVSAEDLATIQSLRDRVAELEKRIERHSAVIPARTVSQWSPQRLLEGRFWKR